MPDPVMTRPASCRESRYPRDGTLLMTAVGSGSMANLSSSSSRRSLVVASLDAVDMWTLVLLLLCLVSSIVADLSTIEPVVLRVQEGQRKWRFEKHMLER